MSRLDISLLLAGLAEVDDGSRGRRGVFWPNEIAAMHVINRTVHPCCLLVDDPVSGKDFDSRKDWMQDQLEVEAHQFGFDWIRYVLVVNIFYLIL